MSCSTLAYFLGFFLGKFKFCLTKDEQLFHTNNYLFTYPSFGSGLFFVQIEVGYYYSLFQRRKSTIDQTMGK